MLHAALLLWLAAPSLAAAEVPDSLFFGLSGLEQRLVMDPPLTTVSGPYRLELVEVDRLTGESGREARLILRVTAAPGAELAVLGEIYAIDQAGLELPARSYQLLREPPVTWLTFTLGISEAAQVAAFSAAIGRRPETRETRIRLPLQPLGAPHRLEQVGWTAAIALLRHEPTPLVIPADPPPLYRGIDGVRHPSREASGADDAQPYLTIRLYTLSPRRDDDWRLADLELTSGGLRVDDWRYSRYPWRPDWGGWLGVTGRDWIGAATGGPTRGVRVDELVPNGPGSVGGLAPDDIIVAADGLAVTDAFTLGERVRTSPGNGKIRLDLWRDGHPRQQDVGLQYRALWPEIDPLEFEQAWSLLSGIGGDDADRVLSLWDWQTRDPVPAGPEPQALELIFRRSEPLDRTTFLFRQIPLQASGQRKN